MDKKIDTELIKDKVEQCVDMDQAYTYDQLIEGNFKNLITIIENLVEKKPTFKEYIIEYICETDRCFDKYSNYNDIPEDELYEYIKNSFENHGIKDISLKKIKNVLNKSGISIDAKYSRKNAYNIARQDIFLFAFGLGMETEDVSRMLCKALLTYDFNPKDYKEVIYYWCLNKKNIDSITTPYIKMIELIEFYKNISTNDEAMLENSYDTNNLNYNTIVLRNTVEDINTEEELKNYLVRLKRSDPEELSLKGITESFDRIINELKYDEYYDFTGLDEKFGNLSVDKLIERFKNDRKKMYDNYIKNSNQDNSILINESVLGKIFEGLNLSKKVIEKRTSTKNMIISSVLASRRELLLYAFILFCRDHGSYEDFCGDIKESYYNLNERVEQILTRCNMTSYKEHGLYLRNPFELFLSICSICEEPYRYFMSSWEIGDRYNNKK